MKGNLPCRIHAISPEGTRSEWQAMSLCINTLRLLSRPVPLLRCLPNSCMTRSHWPASITNCDLFEGGLRSLPELLPQCTGAETFLSQASQCLWAPQHPPNTLYIHPPLSFPFLLLCDPPNTTRLTFRTMDPKRPSPSTPSYLRVFSPH